MERRWVARVCQLPPSILPLRSCRPLSAWMGHHGELACMRRAGGRSVAVVHTKMMRHGLNGTDFGKAVPGACFIVDVGTVVTLGLIFSPFTIKPAIYGACCGLTHFEDVNRDGSSIAETQFSATIGPAHGDDIISFTRMSPPNSPPPATSSTSTNCILGLGPNLPFLACTRLSAASRPVKPP